MRRDLSVHGGALVGRLLLLTVHGSRLRRELLDSLLRSRLVSLLLAGRVKVSRSLLLLQGWHDLAHGSHALLARLGLRISVLRRASHLSRLHELAIDVLLMFDVRVVGHSLRALGRVARVNGRLESDADRLHVALLHRLVLLLLILGRRLRRKNSGHVADGLRAVDLKEALSIISEVLECITDESDLAIIQAVARSVDEALNARQLIAHSVARDADHLALVVLEASSLALLLEVQRHRNQAVLLRQSGGGSARRRRFIVFLTRVVDGSEVRHEQSLIKRVMASLVHGQVEDGAANLEKISRKVTLEVLHSRLVVLLLQVRPDQQIVLRVAEQVVEFALVLLGRQEVASGQQMKSLKNVDKIELTGHVQTVVDNFIVFFVEIANVLHVGYPLPLLIIRLGILSAHRLIRSITSLLVYRICGRQRRLLINQILRLLEQGLVLRLEHAQLLKSIIADLLQLLLILGVNALLDALPFVTGQVALITLSLSEELHGVNVHVINQLLLLGIVVAGHLLAIRVLALDAVVGRLVVGASDAHARAHLLLRVH